MQTQAMKRLYMQFRIGEKVAISFGLMGLLFLAVIWQYNQTLQRSLSDYQRLQGVFAAKKSHALLIENHMLKARRAEKDFLLHRSEESAVAVTESLNRVLAQAEALSQVDSQGAETGARIADLVRTYQQRFDAVAEAWHTKGLDHNSGLQGAFRDAVHELEARAEHFKIGGLYLQLLQIRRGEKDLGLRREALYRDKVIGLIGAFEDRIKTSGLGTELKQGLLREANVYRETFLIYAEAVMAQKDIQGGKGSFRQAAHRIEALLNTHFVSDLGRNILQLRRREKDYLLRGDRQYVDMALREQERIENQLDNSAIAEVDKRELKDLLNAYRRDFLALVEQNREIDRLHSEMRSAVAEMTPLLHSNVREAERTLQVSTERLHTSSAADARFMLWVAALAALLGVIYTMVTITLGIARPLRRMAGLLDQVAYEEPIERIPTVPGGRDEVNAMAQSVNAMADHKAHFLDWWKSSMREAEALEQASAQPDSVEAREELEQSQRAKQVLGRELQEKIRTLIRSVSEHAQRLEQSHPQGKRLEDTQEIEQASKSALAILDVMLGPDRPAA